jgi:hypothetical protein
MNRQLSNATNLAIAIYADQLKEANLTQETLKETCKEVSGEAVNIFNGIYDEIIGISKIAFRIKIFHQ